MVPADSESTAVLDVPIPVTPVTPVTEANRAGRRRIRLLPISIAVVAVLAGSALFLSGYTMGRQAAAEPGTPVSAAEAFQPFWDAYHTITDRYAGGGVDRNTLIQGAIR